MSRFDRLLYHPAYVLFGVIAIMSMVYHIYSGSVVFGISLLITQIPWIKEGFTDGKYRKGWNKWYKHIDYDDERYDG